ncbi:S9 family peptidase [Geofilum sp. OHC36d9]|uniref:S9 family peptidase n=1 Tax=Geofilum sp. OHC36d9 TaxID=3458413 RepID=UPI004033E02F
MKRTILLWAIILSVVTTNAQKKQLTLENFVTDYTFKPKNIPGLKSMNDGEHYTVLEANGSKIVKYAYATGKQVAVIADIPGLKESPITSIADYEFSLDESKLLVYTNRTNIYRRSFTADYYVIDIQRHEIEALSENGAEQVATFSPDGIKVAYVQKNNIYIKNLRFETTNRITDDGEFNHIINGVPDWVYEEEFGYNKAFDWSPDSEELAYVKFNETEVKEFSFPLYEASYPSYKAFELYPGEYKFKYPKSGSVNSAVSVHVFNLRHRTTKAIETGLESGGYIPRVMWTNSPDKLAVVRLNRQQNQLDLYIANPASGVANVIFTDRNQRYISEEVLDNIKFLPDGQHFVYVGELDGYNHIHLYTMAGKKVQQITSGQWDVTSYLGYDSRKKTFYFQAAAQSPLRREIYSIRRDGTKMTRLTPRDGFNTTLFSRDFKYCINQFSNTTTPPVFTVYNQSWKPIRTIEDNAGLNALTNEYDLPAKTFFTFTTQEGESLNGWMIKPMNFDKTKKYPALMTQYSGPNSQEVLDKWDMDWAYFLASKDYVVVCVDGRGTGARGEDFCKQTYMQLGLLESDDQISTARYLSGLSYIDAQRIGIWGWSFGGYMTTMALSRSDLFRVGIAVAPTTDWKFYDTAYTERFMRSPKENPSGYKNTSSLQMADKLNGRLFIIHGTADDNVHFQNTMEYVDRLVQADKQFDMFVYPNRNHSIFGGNTRHHLYKMMFDYLEKNLKQ